MNDERDERLAELYRLSSREQPPARLDRAVMAEARQSLRRRTLSPFGNHWVAAGALAGIGIVSVLLVLLLPEQTGISELPQSMRDADAPELLKQGRSPAATVQEEAGDVMQESAVAGSEATAPARQRFEFYSVLPEAEPEIPAEDRNLPAAPASAPAVALPQTGQAHSYYLQLGGYRSQAEAGKMQDKLEFMRLNVRVQQIRVDDGQSFYRLSVGPYADLAELERVQALLQRRGIESTRERVQ